MSMFPMPCRAKHDILQRKEFLWKRAAYDEWFLIIPISGCFSCTMRGQTQTVSEGELCFFPPGVTFDRRVIEDLKMHYISIEWNCTDEELVKAGCYPLGRVDVSDQNRLHGSLRMLRSIFKACTSDRSEAVLHFVRDIWMQVLTDQTNIFHEPLLRTNDPIVDRAIEYINAHLHEAVAITDVSAYCGLSHIQLTNRFTRVVGTSPIKYLTNVRIQKARNLLCGSTLSVAQIAAMCGYENQFYFSKRFRMLMGLSPQQYRNSLEMV